jgi:acyl-coenzyme A thioesterase PaaI-like protein
MHASDRTRRDRSDATGSMPETAIQDLYPDDVAHCYGCGRLNRDGLHVRTLWDGEGVGTARFAPLPQHVAMPGYVYGGLLASLIDCHGIGTAAAASMERDGQVPGLDPSPRFVTGSLRVDYLKPTPMGPELVLTARPRDVGPRKVLVDVEVEAGGVVTVRGEVLAVRMPEGFTAG